MSATKILSAIIALAIIIGLGFTIKGIAATTAQAESIKRYQMALNASAARWSGLAERSAELKAQPLRIYAAQADRLTAMAEFYTAPRIKAQTAQTDRLTAMANFYAAKFVRANQAHSARLTAMAKYYNQILTSKQQRIREAETARWSGLAAHYFAEQP